MHGDQMLRALVDIFVKVYVFVWRLVKAVKQCMYCLSTLKR